MCVYLCAGTTWRVLCSINFNRRCWCNGQPLDDWKNGTGTWAIMTKHSTKVRTFSFFPLYFSLCRLYVVPAALSNVLSNALSAAFVLCCKMFQWPLPGWRPRCVTLMKSSNFWIGPVCDRYWKKDCCSNCTSSWATKAKSPTLCPSVATNGKFALTWACLNPLGMYWNLTRSAPWEAAMVADGAKVCPVTCILKPFRRNMICIRIRGKFLLVQLVQVGRWSWSM